MLKQIEKKQKPLVYVGIALLIAVMLFFIFQNKSGTISTDFGSSDDQSTSPLYFSSVALNNNQISATQQDNGKSYRNVQTESVTVHSNVKNPDRLTELELSTVMDATSGNVYAALPCEDCTATYHIPVFLEALATTHVYKRQLANGVFSYSTNSLADVEKVNSPEKWIRSLENSELTIAVTREMSARLNWNSLANPAASANDVATTIDARFFGDQELYIVAASETVTVSFVKEELEKSDTDMHTTIELRDLSSYVLQEHAIPTDPIGDTNNVRTNAEHTVSFSATPGNVYKLFFNTQDQSDTQFTDVTINSDKIAFIDADLETESPIYTSSNQSNSFQYTPYSLTYPSIELRNTDTSTLVETLNIQNEKNSERFQLPAGTTTIEGGIRGRLNGPYFYFDTNHIFDPYIKEIRFHDEANADIILTALDANATDDTRQWSTTSSFSERQLYEWKEEVQFERGDTVSVDLVVESNSDHPNIAMQIFSGRYIPVGKICGVNMYSLYETEVTLPNTTCSQDILVDHIRQIIPASYPTSFLANAVTANDFIEVSGVDNYSNGETTYPIASRGGFSAVFYTEEDLSITVHKEDLNVSTGSDDVHVELVDTSGTVIDSAKISDDGQVEGSKVRGFEQSATVFAPNASGVYFLRIVSTPFDTGTNDFSITRISANTNKMIISGTPIVVSNDTQLYTESESALLISGYSWTKKSPDDPDRIYINGEEMLTFSKENRKKTQRIYLDAGQHELQTQHSNTSLRVSSTSPLALSQESFFSMATYAPGTTYLVTDQILSPEVRLYSMSLRYNK